MSLSTLQNFTIQQGATWTLSFEWLDDAGVPIDLTGCTARMQLRAVVGSAVLLELSTTNGRLTLTGALGVIRLQVDAATTATLDRESGVYDLRITYPTGQVDVAIYGQFTLQLAVTK
jgi:hypothetical protein